MSERQEPVGDLHSVPALLARNASRFGDRPACREKEFGIWQNWIWTGTADEVRALAPGFLVLGLRSGDHVAVIGHNRPARFRCRSIRMRWPMRWPMC